MINRKLHMIMTAIVLLAACAWLPFAALNSSINIWLRIVLILVGTLAFIVLFERDMYLPFLADCAFPTSLITPTKSTESTSDTMVTLAKLPPNAKVVYWAATSKDPRAIGSKSWKDAYGDYTNAGVTVANTDGLATVYVSCPQPYTVSHFNFYQNEIPPHIHYRYVLPGTKGMLSEVFTAMVICNKK